MHVKGHAIVQKDSTYLLLVLPAFVLSSVNCTASKHRRQSNNVYRLGHVMWGLLYHLEDEGRMPLPFALTLVVFCLLHL